MRIPSGSTDRTIAFVAVDATDLKTRETGLSGFTVYRSRNGGAPVAYTTPTVAELSAANMPGVYVLTLDEDTTLGAGHDTEEYVVHITQASMAPVTRAVELYRPETTEGSTLLVDASGIGDADVRHWLGSAPNALVSGRVDTSVGAMASGVVTATAIATDAIDGDAIAASAVTEIQSGLATASALATVQADTDDIQSRLPAALVSGRMDVSVGAMAANVVTAAAIATNAIDADAIAADAVTELRAIVSGTADSGTTTTMVDAARTETGTDHWRGAILLITSGTMSGAMRVVTGFTPASDTLTFAPALPSAITTETYELLPGGNAIVEALASAVITSSVIATDAIGSAQLAASAVTEIQTGLATSSALATVQADTDDIQARLPAALVSGRMDVSVGAMATDVLTATALAASAVTEIQSGLATASALATVDGKLPAALVGGRIDASVGAMAANVVTAAAIATDAIDGDAIAATAVTEIQSGLATSSALATAQADLDDIQTRIPAALVSGRMNASVGAVAPAAITAAAFAADAIDNNAVASSAVTEITASVTTQLTDIQGRLPAALTGGRMDAAVGAMTSDVITAASVSAGAANKVADHTLRRTYANARASSDGDAVSFRSLLGAIAKLVNKWSITGTTLTVTHEDDATTAGTQTLTASPGADPISASDTV